MNINMGGYADGYMSGYVNDHIDVDELVQKYEKKGKLWLLNKLSDERLVKKIEEYNVARDNLYEFFNANEDVNIVPLLNSGLKYVPLVKNYVDENLILFRPAHSHKRFSFGTRFHDGKIEKNKSILFLDEDIYSGVALGESMEHFSRQGYSKDKMFAYIHLDKFHDFGSYKITKANDLIKSITDNYNYKEFNEEMIDLFNEDFQKV